MRLRLAAALGLLLAAAAARAEPPAVAAPPANTVAATPPPIGVPLAGRVLRKGDRVPLVAVDVLVDDGAAHAVTDADGAFAFDALPPGDHVLHLRAATIQPIDQPITLKPDKRLALTLFVPGRERYATTVRGRRAVVEVVEQTLQADEIKRIPGTQGDALKAVQNLPGVARAPFGLGLLVVWGSAPQDTRTYVDGVYIPTLYHFGGLRSTVNSETVTATMPPLGPTELGRPDASGGVYLTVRARVSAGSDSLSAAYRLREYQIGPPNQNPRLTAVFRVTPGMGGADGGADGGAGDLLTALDEGTPLVVHMGDQVILRAEFAPGSAETYPVFDGDPRTTMPRMLTETLSVAWFTTAGSLADGTTGVDRPDAILHFDPMRGGNPLHLPPSGSTIDLWAVGRDERGGTSWIHRTLLFQ